MLLVSALDALDKAYRTLGFDKVVEDDVFRDLVLARIIEPTSKQAAVERVLPEVGVKHASYRTVKRHLRLYSAVPSEQPGSAPTEPNGSVHESTPAPTGANKHRPNM